MEFSVFQFTPIPSCPVTEHHWEEPGSIFFIHTLQVFINTDKTPLGLLSSRLSSSSYRSPSSCQLLQSLNHLFGPALDWLQYVYSSLILRSPDLDPELQVCLTSAEQRGRIISFKWLATSLLVQPRLLLSFFLARAHCWLMVNFLSTTML